MDMRESGFLVRDLSLYRHGCGGGEVSDSVSSRTWEIQGMLFKSERQSERNTIYHRVNFT